MNRILTIIIRGYTNIKYLGVETFVKQINIKYVCIKNIKILSILEYFNLIILQKDNKISKEYIDIIINRSKKNI